MSDYLVQRPPVRSPVHGAKQFSNDRIKTITKLKIQEYIDSFFNRIGENHDLLGVVSPRSITYNTSRSFDPATDPTQRKMQIARYYNEIKSVLPSILILDGGIIPMPQSIGQISDSKVVEQNWYGYYPIVRKIPITVLIAARDQETCDDLGSLATLMFNELRNLAGGHYITGKQEEGETWVITLPNEGVPIGPNSEIDVPNDPVDKFFVAEMSFEVMFEDVISVKQQIANFTESGVYLNKPNVPSMKPPEIVITNTISLNQSIILLVRNINDRMRIIISDPYVATITYDMKLTPRKRGKFNIIVIDPSIVDKTKQVLASKEVTVI